MLNASIKRACLKRLQFKIIKPDAFNTATLDISTRNSFESQEASRAQPSAGAVPRAFEDASLNHPELRIHQKLLIELSAN